LLEALGKINLHVSTPAVISFSKTSLPPYHRTKDIAAATMIPMVPVKDPEVTIQQIKYKY